MYLSAESPNTREGSDLVQMGSKSSELKKFVLLKPPSKANVIEVVEAIDRVTECLVVLFFNKEVVVSIIYSFNVQLA